MSTVRYLIVSTGALAATVLICAAGQEITEQSMPIAITCQASNCT